MTSSKPARAIRRLLIANRGEIAVRVARTARAMGIRTIAVHSDVDAGALFVECCDEAYSLGGTLPRKSYLDAGRVLDIARRARADAVHPGYGFLSENETFARAVADAGMTFVGPPPEAIAAMGSKSAAKRIMAKAGVPLVPGYHGDDQSPALLAREAAAIGFPVLVKAVAGGGGKGMKVAHDAAGFGAALAAARREAKAAFGDDRVLVEKYLAAPRHIEIQVFADTLGNALHLNERDCSVQRRHQKVLEEAPAPGMTAERRRAMGEAAVAAAKAIGYVGAGTVEFIAEQDGRFFFMEMNTRLQVEHPVTEMITGLDLVEWQLRVARGEPLPLAQGDVRLDGHAIEARLYAEDPARGFLPSTGTIAHWRMPAETRDVRVDTGFRAGDSVSPYYDPMLAKLIVHADDRAGALARLHAALAQCEVVGVTTNVEFLGRVVTLPAFAEETIDTGLIDRHKEALFAPRPDASLAWLAAAVAEWHRPRHEAFDADVHSPWHARDAWWPNSAGRRITFAYREGDSHRHVALAPQDDRHAEARIDGRAYEVAVVGAGGERIALDVDGVRRVATVVARGDERHVFVDGAHHVLRRADPLAVHEEADDSDGHLRAPMSGTIVAVMAKAGDAVTKSAPLVVLEAMKMEHTIVAPHDGTVSAVNCRVGERVAEGADLVDLDAAAG